VVAVIVAQ